VRPASASRPCSRLAALGIGDEPGGDPFLVALAMLELREGYEDEVGELGLAEHRLGRLPAGEASEVLDTVAPGLDPALRARVLSEAAGNPLALVELPTGADATAGGSITDGGALPLAAHAALAGVFTGQPDRRAWQDRCRDRRRRVGRAGPRTDLRRHPR
jgi:hypothetical protein